MWLMKPSVGLGPLNFGMSSKEIVSILGACQRIRQRDQEESYSYPNFISCALKNGKIFRIGAGRRGYFIPTSTSSNQILSPFSKKWESPN